MKKVNRTKAFRYGVVNQHLRVFHCISVTNSFTKTGELLGVSQSSITKHIKRLEEELGGKLIDRSHGPAPRGALTDKGVQASQLIQSIINKENELKVIFK